MTKEISTECECGRKFIIKWREHGRTIRRDGKRVIDAEVPDDGWSCSFRCRGCGRVVHESVHGAEHEDCIAPSMLAPRHRGMRISASGLLGRVGGRLKFGASEMNKHLHEMAERFYKGDIKAVDEFLQCYDLDASRPEVDHVD